MTHTIDKRTIKCYKFEVEVPEDYKVDQEVTILLQGHIVDRHTPSNEDGTVNVVAIFKPTLVDVVKQDAK